MSCEYLICPYCKHNHGRDLTEHEDAFNEIEECDNCGKKFKYSCFVTLEYEIEKIDGEDDDSGTVEEPDPNQITLFEFEAEV